jgi:hypothetical protein
MGAWVVINAGWYQSLRLRDRQRQVDCILDVVIDELLPELIVPIMVWIKLRIPEPLDRLVTEMVVDRIDKCASDMILQLNNGRCYRGRRGDEAQGR